MSNRPITILVLAVVALVAAASPAGADGSYLGRVQVASGRYIFAERTTSLYVVNGIDLSNGRFHLSAALPVIVQSTPWVTFSPVPIPSGGTGSGQVGAQIGEHAGRGGGIGGRNGTLVVTLAETSIERHAGIGDPVVRGGVDLLSTSATGIRLAAVVKAPFAQYEDGFGTGEWDFGAGVSLDRTHGTHRAFGALEFWRIGDLADLALKDAAMYQAGYEKMFNSRRWSALAVLQGWSSVLEDTDPPIEFGLGVARHLSSSGRIGVSASFGLTQTAPDVSLSVDWQVPFEE
jgi:hypothetical protein